MTDTTTTLSEAEAANRLMRLAKEIARHNKRYHADDDPEISDADYDALVRENNALEAAFPQLIRADSPNKLVGASVASSALAKVRHEKRMMSLDNAFSAEDVEEFVARVRRYLNLPEGAPVAMTAEDRCAMKAASSSRPRRGATARWARMSRPTSHTSPTSRRCFPQARPISSRCAARSIWRRRRSRRSTPAS